MALPSLMGLGGSGLRHYPASVCCSVAPPATARRVGAIGSNRLGDGGVSGGPSSKEPKKPKKKEHHLWMRRDPKGSGQKALNLVHIVSKLPNEKEAVYGALDKWTAWETEFPVIAAAKALEILRRRSEWLKIIQVTKWLMSKGQVLTWGTYDSLLLALSMEGRVDEATSIWNSLLQVHTRSISRRLFSRIISLYDRHHCPEKIVEVFGDMEELGIHPDEDTARRIGRAFVELGKVEKRDIILNRYLKKWRYLHFNGERVRVRRQGNLSKAVYQPRLKD